MKRDRQGLNDIDTKLKLVAIEKKLKAYGGSLNSEAVNHFNENLAQLLNGGSAQGNKLNDTFF